MHKWALILVMVAALGFMGQSLRASEVPIGAYTNYNCVPFGCPNFIADGSGFAEYQQIYSLNSFTYPLGFATPYFDIAAISFFNTASSGAVTPGIYTFSLSSTSAAVGTVPDPVLNLSLDKQVLFSGPLGGALGTVLTVGVTDATKAFAYNLQSGNNLLLDITIQLPSGSLNTGLTLQAENPSSSMSIVTNSLPDTQGLVTTFSDVPLPPPVVSTTPEPGSMLLFGTGLAAVLRHARRKS